MVTVSAHLIFCLNSIFLIKQMMATLQYLSISQYVQVYFLVAFDLRFAFVFKTSVRIEIEILPVRTREIECKERSVSYLRSMSIYQI